MVSTRDVNIGVFTDPAQLLVEAAKPSSVDRRGRRLHLKRRGNLTASTPAGRQIRRPPRAPPCASARQLVVMAGLTPARSRGGTGRDDALFRTLAYFDGSNYRALRRRR